MRNAIIICFLAWGLCSCHKSCDTCSCGGLEPQLFTQKWQFSGFSNYLLQNYYQEQINMFIPHDSMIRPIWIQFDNCQMTGQLESSVIYGHIDSPRAYDNGIGRLVIDFPTDTNSIPQEWDRQFVSRIQFTTGFQVDNTEGMILKYNDGNIGDILVLTPMK